MTGFQISISVYGNTEIVECVSIDVVYVYINAGFFHCRELAPRIGNDEIYTIGEDEKIYNNG